MRPMMLFAGAVMLAATSAAGAQAPTATGMGQMDKMNMTKTYVGCLTRTAEGQYRLTNATAADTRSDKPMGSATMATGSDAMSKETMARDSMGKGAMGKDAMKSLSLDLTSAKVDLSKHAGHQVSVLGSDGEPMGKTAMFTVTSLTMIASTCTVGGGR